MSDGLPREKVEAIIEKIDPTILQGLPPEVKQKVVTSVAILAASAIQYSGPVPPASMLVEYSQAIPNGGDRLFTMVESQSAHRHCIEGKVIDGQIKQSDRGQLMAFVLILVLIAVGVLAFMTDHGTVAGVIFSTTIGAVATVFALGKRAQKADLKAKNPKPSKPDEGTLIVPDNQED